MDAQAQENILPLVCSLVPLISLVVLIGATVYWLCLHKSFPQKEKVCSIIWLAPFAILLLTLTVFCILGLCKASVATLLVGSVLIALMGCLTLLRTTFHMSLSNSLNGNSLLFSAIRDIVVLVIAVVVSFFILEVPWNERIATINVGYALVEMFVIAIPFVALYFFGGRRGGVLVFPLFVWGILGLAQYFVAAFKQAAIVPSDLLALGTALSVGGGYQYVMGDAQVNSLAILPVGLAALSLMVPHDEAAVFDGAPCNRHTLYRKCAYRIAGGSATILIALALFNAVNLTDCLGFTDFYWDTLNVYKSQGIAGSFVSLLQNARRSKPDGYSEAEASDLLASYLDQYDATWGSSSNRIAAEQQFSQMHPTVIAIMDESFSDLSIYNNLNCGYEGPALLKGVGDALYTGNIYTSVIGGGTCNSEFEFLTSISLWSVGTQNQPYVMNNLSHVDSLPKQLSTLGYNATAIHPNSSTNWNREAAYQQLGFGQFLDITSFASDSPIRHAGVTDATTYNKILEILQGDSAPQFIFDVTMQNHGGYDTFDLPEEERLPYDVSWLGEPTATQTSEYMSLVNTSDRELVSFIDQLRAIDRPVVLVFFGDHQPSMGSAINEAINPGADADDPNIFERMYQTPYIIWANYDVAGNDQISERKDIGLYSLSALVFQSIGAPLSDLQKVTMVVSDTVPVLNGYGYQTADAVWHSLDNADNLDKAVRDLEWLHYLEGTSLL